MENEELKKRLDDYIKDDTYNYAFLIDGDWGVGKTYFIKNIFKEFTTRKIVYISLFGRNDINDLRNTINFNIAFNSNTKNKKVIDNLSEINLSIRGLNFNTRNAKELITKAKAAKKRNYVLVFDDLERCDCEIKDILGLINEYVEQTCSKVVILVDTNKLESKKDEFDKFQEKVVGVRIKYTPDYMNTIKDIVDKQDVKNRMYLLDSLNKLDGHSKEFNKYNIRTFLFFLSKIDYLLTNISKKYKAIFPEIIENCYCSCVYYKDYGKYYTWDANESFGTVGYDLNIKDNIENDEDQLFHISDIYFKGFKFVDDYIVNGDFNKDNINKILDEYIEISNNAKDDEDLKLLSNWNIYNDKEVNDAANQIIEKLKSRKFSISSYPQIISLFSELESNSIITKKYSKMENAMYENAKESHNFNEIIRMHLSDYLSVSAKEKANKTIKKIKNILNENSIKDEKDVLNNLINNEDWGFELYNYCCDKYKQHIVYNFIDYVDVDALISKFDNISGSNCSYFDYTLKIAYGVSNYAEVYYANLEKLILILNKVKTTRKYIRISNNKILVFNLDKLIDNLNIMIEDMKSYKERNNL